MAQTSAFWAGLLTGDAGPYSDAAFTDWFKRMFIVDNTKQGIIAGYGDELALTNADEVLHVGTGYAMVDGKFYANTEQVDFTLTPGTGIYYNFYTVVLRKDLAAQTVRLDILGPNAEAYPSVTQTDTIWEIALGHVKISTSSEPAVVIDPFDIFIAKVTERKFLVAPSNAYDVTHDALVDPVLGTLKFDIEIITGAAAYFVVPADYIGRMRISAAVVSLHNPTGGNKYVYVKNTFNQYYQDLVISSQNVQYIRTYQMSNEESVKPGDIKQITFYRDATSELDTTAYQLIFLGWLIEYDSIS